MRRFTFCCLLGLGCLLCAGGLAEDFWVYSCVGNNADAVLTPTAVEGVAYLFLPACVPPEAVPLYAQAGGWLCVAGDAGRSARVTSGQTVNIAALFAAVPADGRYAVTVTAENGATQSLTLLFSQNVAAVFVISDDPAAQGCAYVDGSWAHETCASGSLVMLREDGSAVYDGGLRQIRGRGNATWGNYPLAAGSYTTVDKKPYQLKLETKADLTDSGDPAEASRTWVLLAEYYDGTLLRNRISFDLARELGQTEAPRCRTVDLFYDGAYRGQYLLAEKVEVGKGRVDIADYDDLLESMNSRIGVDIEAQTQVTGQNRYGMPLAATGGVQDGGSATLGGYLVELDNAYYASERAYFTLRSGAVYTLRNPEYATLAMVESVSETFEALGGALAGYGVNAETGQRYEELLDVGSALPYLWVNLLAQNPDAWLTSSTYFAVPEGGGKVRLGPVWDFDVAYTQRNQTESVDDLFARKGAQGNWAQELLCIPSFQSAAKAFFTQRLTPAVSILLGREDVQGACLHSLSWYWNETAASRRMNDVLWDPEGFLGRAVSQNWEENYTALRSFLSRRFASLARVVAAWPEAQPAQQVDVTLRAPYGAVEESLCATVDAMYQNAAQPAVSLTLECEATAEAFAVYRADITLSPKPDVPFAADTRVMVNGVQAAAILRADGTLAASVWFVDPSYRPAVYQDTDYGLVFDADYCRVHCPQAVAQAGDSAQALLTWYVETGMAQWQQANAFFNPREVLEAVPDIAELYGQSAEGAVQYFLESGYVDLMETMGRTFAPEVWVGR